MPQQRPTRRPMPQGTAAKQNTHARERAIHAEEQRKIRCYRRQKRAEALAYAARIFFLAFLASVIVGILAVFLVKRDFSRAPEKFSYSLTVKKDEKTVSLKKGTVVRDNTLYVSLEDLADLIGFRLMGDAKIMNTVFSDRSDDERVSVYLDTDSAVYGKTVRLLGAQSYFSGSSGDVYVPISFLENSFDNVTLTGVQKGARIDYTLTVSGESRLGYSTDAPVPLPDVSGIDTSTLPDNAFLTDLSAYEKYMDPENADDYIRLINKDHPLGKDYIPPDLTDISEGTRRHVHRDACRRLHRRVRHQCLPLLQLPDPTVQRHHEQLPKELQPRHCLRQNRRRDRASRLQRASERSVCRPAQSACRLADLRIQRGLQMAHQALCRFRLYLTLPER